MPLSDMMALFTETFDRLQGSLHGRASLWSAAVGPVADFILTLATAGRQRSTVAGSLAALRWAATLR